MQSVRKSTSRSERMVHIEALLDDALRMTFPASDPIALAVDIAPAEANKETRQNDVHPSQPDAIRKPER